MNKIITGLAVAASLLIAAPAFASTFTNVQFQNGDVAIQGAGGSTVQATFRVVVPANEVVEKIQTDVIGDNLGPICTDVGDGTLGLQEGTHDVTLSIKLPPNTGTYTLAVQGSGIYGAFRTVDCTNNIVGSASFSSALKVVDSSTSGSVGNVPVGIPSDVWAKFLAWVSGTATTPTPATSAVCTAYAQANAGTQSNVYSDANVRLQGFLLSQGASIPALKAGASFGFYGNQTTAAVGWFNSTNHCN